MACAIQAIDIPSPRKIAQGYQEANTTIVNPQGTSLALPGSGYVIARMEKIWKSLHASDPSNKLVRFESDISETQLNPVVRAIHSSEEFLAHFKRDYLGIVFDFYSMSLSESVWDFFLRWADLMNPEPSKIFGLFSIRGVQAKRFVRLLLWSLETLKGVDPALLPPRDFILRAPSEAILAQQAQQYVHLTIENIIAELVRSETPEEDCVNSLSDILSRCFKKFSAFGFLWSELVSEPAVRPLSELQTIIFFQAIMYLLFSHGGVDLSNLNWKTIGAVQATVKKSLLGMLSNDSRGFSITTLLIQDIWNTFVVTLVSPERRPAVLFSFLDFFLLSDLKAGGRDPDYLRAPGFVTFSLACHSPTRTLEADIEMLVELFDETSRHSEIWGLLPPFVITHTFLDLLNSGRDLPRLLEADIEKLLSGPQYQRRVEAFVPPHFRDNPEPVTRDVIFSLFTVFEYMYRSDGQTNESLLEEFDRLKEAPAGPLNQLRDKALQVAVITKASKDLSNMKKNFEAEAMIWTEGRFAGILAILLKENLTRQFFFLHSLHSTDRAAALLKLSQLCRFLGLATELTKTPVSRGSNLFSFPFMINNTTPEGQEYEALLTTIQAGDEANVRALITAQCGRDSTAYLRVRVYLASIAYYMYYNSAQPCPMILSAVRALVDTLHLDSKEIRAYEVLTQGDVPYNENDALSTYFSKEGTDQDGSKLVYRNVLANLLIFTLGCPKSSSPLQVRVFETEKMNTAMRGPGSAYDTDKDCGYQMTVDGKFSPPAPILGGSQLYRLAVCMMTWGAVTMSLLLDPATNIPQLKKFCVSDGKSGYKNQNHLTPAQIITEYLVERPNAFYYWITLDVSLQNSQIDPAFFVTQSLYLYWKDLLRTHGTPDGAAYRSTFQSSAQTTAFENRLKEFAFDVVIRDAVALREPYEAYLRKTEVLGRVLQHRDALSNSLKRSVQILSNATFIQESAGADPGLTSLHNFKNFSRFKIIQFLPSLVAFHHWLYENLRGKITPEELPTLTVRAAIQRIESVDSRHAGERLLATTAKNWAVIKENHPAYQVCHVAQERGEATIASLTADSLLISFIKPEKDEIIEADHLQRVINDICAIQNALIGEDVKEEFSVSLLPGDLRQFSYLVLVQKDDEAIDWVKPLATLGPDGVLFQWELIDQAV